MTPTLAYDESWAAQSTVPPFLELALDRCNRTVIETLEITKPSSPTEISRLFGEIRKECLFHLNHAAKVLEYEFKFPIDIHSDMKDLMAEPQNGGAPPYDGIGRPDVVQTPLANHFKIDFSQPTKQRTEFIAYVVSAMTVYMRCHRISKLWEASFCAKFEAKEQGFDEVDRTMEMQAAKALRDFADDLYARSYAPRNSEEKAARRGIPWSYTDVDDPGCQRLHQAMSVESGKADPAARYIQNYTMNLLPRCHLGLRAAKENEFVHMVIPSLSDAQAASIANGGTEISAEFMREVAGMKRLATTIVFFVDAAMLTDLASRVPFRFVQEYIRGHFSREPLDQYLKILELSEDSGDGAFLDRAQRFYAAALWWAEILGNKFDVRPLPLPQRKSVEDLREAFRKAHLQDDSEVLQELMHDGLPNAMFADMLLLLGIPEVDPIIPSTLPISIGARAKEGIESSWKIWSRLLHVDLPDYSAVITNISKAVERQLAEVIFLPFERAARESNWFDPQDEDAANSKVLKPILSRIKNGDESTVELGKAAFLLDPFSSITPSYKESDGVFRKQWRAFICSRGDRFTPSMIKDLGAYARGSRNPASHDAPTFTREQAIEARGRAWLLLRNLSTSDPMNRLNLQTSATYRATGMSEDEIEMYEVWRGSRTVRSSAP